MSEETKLVPCVGCAGLFPEMEGPTHRYMESTPGCWACYGEVLAREYSDYRYARVHPLTVDAYAVQHPGTPSPQSIQSVTVHLVSLCAILERDIELRQASKIIKKLTRFKDRFRWLTPPSSMGTMTVKDVHQAGNAEEHIALVKKWAKTAWNAWSNHHPAVREWYSAVNQS